MIEFNSDGSLKVSSRKQDHLTVFNLLDELEFSVGRKLLVQLLRGDDSLRIKRLGLDKLVYHGSLGGHDESDLFAFIEYLLKEEFLSITHFKPTMPVLELTEKARNEMDVRSENISVDEVSFFAKHGFSSRSESPDGGSSSSCPALSIPKFTPISLCDEERAVCEGLSFFFEGFTDEQKKAIVDTASLQICIAGAGSGKTRVLTHKIAYLIRFASVSPSSILAITFTRKARQEMQSRLYDLLGDVARDVRIETFNSFAEKELLKHGTKLYGYHKEMVSNKDFIRLVTQAISDAGFDMSSFLDQYFTSRERRGKDDRELFFSFLYDFRSILSEFDSSDDASRVMESRLSSAKLSERVTANNLVKIASSVSSMLDDRGLRTYSDQIPDLLSLYSKYPSLIPSFSWILVDEYQDVSPLQHSFVGLLSPENVFVVGDPRQSIFAWRGADPSVMMKFMNHCLDTGGHITELSTNFRSSASVLSFANDLIAASHSGRNPYSPLRSFRDEPGSLSIEPFSSDSAEAKHIIDTILKSDISRNSIFVLSRTNKGLENIKRLCDQNGISYLIRTDERSNASVDPARGQITLSTVHAIKGLEAELVFVIGVSSLAFPIKAKDHRFVRMLCTPHEYDTYEEERRLLYVACTRAKTHLRISYVGSPSPFLLTSASGSATRSSASAKMSFSSDRQESQRKALKRWRFLEAKERGVPAYVIFSNKVLDQLLDRQPSSMSELYGISGLGASKIDEFGADIIHILSSN